MGFGPSDFALSPPRTYTHLPAQYVPGIPMLWRYRSIADVEEPGAGAVSERDLGCNAMGR